MLEKKHSMQQREQMSSNDPLEKEERLIWLMDEYGKSVVRLAYTYVRHKQWAEDIAQDVFIKCYENIDDFRKESSYKTWLYRITVNRCKDVLKSWSYKNILFADFLSFKRDSKEQSVESQILLNEENRYISEQVISLSVPLREVIILYYYEGLSQYEIAELLELSENTVKSRMHRARQKLKKLLDGGDGNG